MTSSIDAIGVVADVAGDCALGRAAASCFENMQLPDALPVLAVAAVLSGAKVVASLMPAARAPQAWTRYRRLRSTRKPTTRSE